MLRHPERGKPEFFRSFGQHCWISRLINRELKHANLHGDLLFVSRSRERNLCHRYSCATTRDNDGTQDRCCTRVSHALSHLNEQFQIRKTGASYLPTATV